MRTHAIVLAVLAMASPLSAQAPRGTFSYTAYGIYEGEAMPPWSMEVEEADTLIDGVPAVRSVQRSLPGPDGWIYEYVATWKATDPGVGRSSRRGAGRIPGRCEVETRPGRILASVDGAAAREVPVDGVPVPEFAVGRVLASMRLAPGDSVRLRPYRCEWGSRSDVRVFELKGSVRADSLERAIGGAKEPVLVVTGDLSWPFEAWIARSDGQVLRVVTPQGSVGQMIEAYTGPRGR